MPSQVVDFDFPYVRLYHKNPSYLNLYHFGCVCFVHLSHHYRHKLFAQSVKCVFMGYSVSHRGYVCYDLGSHKFHTSRNVVFFKNQYYYSTHVESSPAFNILPCFDDSPSFPTRFKPGNVYTRCL